METACKCRVTYNLVSWISAIFHIKIYIQIQFSLTGRSTTDLTWLGAIIIIRLLPETIFPSFLPAFLRSSRNAVVAPIFKRRNWDWNRWSTLVVIWYDVMILFLLFARETNSTFLFSSFLTTKSGYTVKSNSQPTPPTAPRSCWWFGLVWEEDSEIHYT